MFFDVNAFVSCLQSPHLNWNSAKKKLRQLGGLPEGMNIIMASSLNLFRHEREKIKVDVHF